MKRRILVAIDLDHPDRAKKLIAEAQAFGGEDAHYHFVVVFPNAGRHMVASFLPKDYDKRIKAEILTNLQNLLASTVNVKNPYETSVRTGTIYEEITDLATQWKADIIVIGAGQGLKVNLGGTALRVNQHSPTSVLTIR